MIPIPVFWTKYEATVHGSLLKTVPCENCATEYVYVLERESSGVGTSVYALNDEGAAEHAKSAAADTLQSVLENDFDPVPCPACGHYQKCMFPKLLEARRTWVEPAMVAVLVLGALSFLIAVYRTIGYALARTEQGVAGLVIAWLILLLVCLSGLGLSLIKRYKARHFDPNLEDRETRLALGRSRAVTRAEFERGEEERRQRSNRGLGRG
jgi:hypothetical protein